MHACSIHGPNLKILPRQNDYLRYPKAHGKLARTISAKDRIDLLFAQLTQTFTPAVEVNFVPRPANFPLLCGNCKKKEEPSNHSAISIVAVKIHQFYFATIAQVP
ncbi:hypothetical protein OIU85_005924 [Salix viminalis]|uniref:Uncharacterized protein n=1 Tax=Salix viminalis TaxID=40686 RepID=A0A9Q0PJT3_SALVM|nr:hypothetical protein OIU85_005924 [Salix viminalis]